MINKTSIMMYKKANDVSFTDFQTTNNRCGKTEIQFTTYTLSNKDIVSFCLFLTIVIISIEIESKSRVVR
jgi:hypothetical protein